MLITLSAYHLRVKLPSWLFSSSCLSLLKDNLLMWSVMRWLLTNSCTLLSFLRSVFYWYDTFLLLFFLTSICTRFSRLRNLLNACIIIENIQHFCCSSMACFRPFMCSHSWSISACWWSSFWMVVIYVKLYEAAVWFRYYLICRRWIA